MSAIQHGRPAPPVARRAVVLYGRVGAAGSAARYLPTDGTGSPEVARWAARSIQRNIISVWARHGLVDVFVHSWNPELATLMDESYAPQGALHQPQNSTEHMSSLVCPKVRITRVNTGLRLTDCIRTQWALLGMQRALQLRSRFCHRHAVEHASILVMRHDVYWMSELPPLDTRLVRMWLPFRCAVRPYCPNNHCAWFQTELAAGIPRKNGNRVLGDSCDALGCPGNHTLNITWASSDEMLQNEWIVATDFWFVGDERVTKAFETAYDMFGNYSKTLLQAGRAHEFSLKSWAPHYFWGAILRSLRLRARCQLGFAMLTGYDFELARETVIGESASRGAHWRKHVIQANEDWRNCSWDGWIPVWKPQIGVNCAIRSDSNSGLDGPTLRGQSATMCPQDAFPSEGHARRICVFTRQSVGWTDQVHKHGPNLARPASVGTGQVPNRRGRLQPLLD